LQSSNNNLTLSIQEWPIQSDFEIGISKPKSKLASFLQISEMLDVHVSTHIYPWGDRYDLSIPRYSKNRMIQHSQFWRLYRIHLLINQREKIDPNRKQMKIIERKKKIPMDIRMKKNWMQMHVKTSLISECSSNTPIIDLHVIEAI